MKELFLNKSFLADIIINIEGQKLFCHKAVVTARCDVMAAMFSGNFFEGCTDITEINIPDTKTENFLAFLEYLYTDNLPKANFDPMGVLVLADQYLQSRLKNLCELYIRNKINHHNQMQMQIDPAEIDVIGLLLKAQFHNAEQLSNWCLHYTSTHFVSFKKKPEFACLTGDNLTYVEKHRWPPVDYLDELNKFEHLVNKK
jgi:Rho family protein